MTDRDVYAMIFVCAGIFLIVEVLLLLGYRLYKKRGIETVALLSNAGAGGCLLIASWLATMHASPVLLCVAVGGAFLFHTVDQAMRWNV